MPSRVETSQESLDRLRSELDVLRVSRERLAVAPRRRAAQPRARAPRRSSAAPCRARRQSPARARAGGRTTRVRQGSSSTQSDAICSWPSPRRGGSPFGSTRRCSRQAACAAAIRAAAASAGVRARIDVETELRYPPEVAGAIYFCCLGVLEGVGEGADAWIDDPGRWETRFSSRSPSMAARSSTTRSERARPSRSARRPADVGVRPGLGHASPARFRSSDDARRSLPGTGSRP